MDPRLFVVLMSGVPGIGKSTYIKTNWPSATVCSADDYWVDTPFNPAELGFAHGDCLRKFIKAIQRPRIIKNGNEVIVVDNTNTTAIELAPYVAIASAYGREVKLITIVGDTHEAYMRNRHGVPFKTCVLMEHAIKTRILPEYWSIEATTVDGAEIKFDAPVSARDPLPRLPL